MTAREHKRSIPEGATPDLLRSAFFQSVQKFVQMLGLEAARGPFRIVHGPSTRELFYSTFGPQGPATPTAQQIASDGVVISLIEEPIDGSAFYVRYAPAESK